MTSEDISAQIATARAVWEELDDETRRRDFSHYRGIGRCAEDEDWAAIGRNTRNILDRMARAAGDDLWARAPVVLEWGPGGGSNVHALLPQARRVYGVDISQSNLDECARANAGPHLSKFSPVLLRADLSEIAAAVSEPVDIFISTAVFQHFPTKEFGRDVLALMSELMAPKAYGFVQIRFDNGRDKYRSNTSLSEYAERYITATSYALDEFVAILEQTGFRDIEIRDFLLRVNYAAFSFRKP